MDIPLGLRQAIENGDCVLFIGAGVGKHLVSSTGAAPTAKKLAYELAEEFDIDTNENDLAKVAQVVELRTNRETLYRFISKRLSGLEPDSTFQWLFSRRWRAIFTTNYDRSIERSYELLANPPQTPVSLSLTADLTHIENPFQVPIYHLHGSLFLETKPELIITSDDYNLFRSKRNMLFMKLQESFATSTMLYIGYSNQDSNWSLLLTELISELSPRHILTSYRVDPVTDPIDIEILRAKRIETLEGTLGDFVDKAQLLLHATSYDGARINRVRSTIPSDLVATFESSPAAVTRLISSWTYVNQADFATIANLTEFLLGNRPNWSLVGSRKIFPRDIEDEVFDCVIDFVTGTRSRASACIVHAPAGYGITTLLMTIGARIVSEELGKVFMLEQIGTIVEGDIEFACGLFPDQPVIFIVDDAARHGEALTSVMRRLADIGKPALFVLGSRLNEWRQARVKPTAKEFSLDALSDQEIRNLISFLQENNKLGVLQNLTDDMRFNSIKNKNRQDLLVTMREVTEGKSFDAILESEYLGIQNSVAKKLYLIVSGFYQEGVPIRDSLLAEMLDMKLAEMYDTTTDGVEGIVIYDYIDKLNRHYGARTRHSIIARVIWNRCATPGERDEILSKAMNRLNITYKLDSLAFNDLIRSKDVVNSINSFDEKTSFFEEACRKDPLNPYVRQHYARMLQREGKLELALQQITYAIELDDSVRVLYHTEGLILGEMAVSQPNIDVGRRYLYRSEASFRRGIGLSRRDHYSYESLARLYFDWARKVTDADDRTLYLSKAEAVISEGLSNARERDSLWIVSANIEAWLHNEPEQILALEKAVSANPNSIVARYLLGRVYRKTGNPQKALDVLSYVVNNHFREYRSFVEYVLALEAMGTSYSKMIAILDQARIDGLSDPRFIATLGGMNFLNGTTEVADKVFDEVKRRNFTYEEENSIQYRPLDPKNTGSALRVKGKIIRVDRGFSLVDTPDYGRILCHATKYNGLVMTVGLEISFQLVFSPKRVVADSPERLST